MSWDDYKKPPIRAVVVEERWSGHGEGGTQTEVKIIGWEPEDVYTSTDGDKIKCHEVADLINKALAAYKGV